MKKKTTLLAVSLLSISIALTFVVYHFRSTSQRPAPKQMKDPIGRNLGKSKGSKFIPSSKSNVKLSDEELEQLLK